MRAKVPMLAPEVEQVILKALKKQPTERFLTIQAFAEALEESSRPKASKVSIGTTLLTYRGHSKFVFAVAWSPDGTRLASGSSDNTVQVWQAV